MAQWYEAAAELVKAWEKKEEEEKPGHKFWLIKLLQTSGEILVFPMETFQELIFE